MEKEKEKINGKENHEDNENNNNNNEYKNESNVIEYSDINSNEATGSFLNSKKFNESGSKNSSQENINNLNENKKSSDELKVDVIKVNDKDKNSKIVKEGRIIHLKKLTWSNDLIYPANNETEANEHDEDNVSENSYIDKRDKIIEYQQDLIKKLESAIERLHANTTVNEMVQTDANIIDCLNTNDDDKKIVEKVENEPIEDSWIYLKNTGLKVVEVEVRNQGSLARISLKNDNLIIPAFINESINAINLLTTLNQNNNNPSENNNIKTSSHEIVNRGIITRISSSISEITGNKNRSESVSSLKDAKAISKEEKKKEKEAKKEMKQLEKAKKKEEKEKAKKEKEEAKKEKERIKKELKEQKKK
ncbi:hypothetical protein H8356DRAFT_1297262 [Neocallimastix lanati (nom. inval.)]|uniref:Uncharacterized protein n=1 Tax=Neocallimastix californiae TaxID=1754190 RepID=A0A1Y2AI89_9FUNG|nr:hypothetical protein H8356DRAFT_1297262 [Neocallimastix sp. JGI-2020a]ORY22301.1 hypothetical protein LY90DRAFT_707195 [Neocallimastix californiae]|eukprot:ORY22301.1 hypothetical protein LY90DRAFT_707195 [Neocallimastix californiae]